MPNEEFAEQLNRLRVRAGNPSVRELAKLTERQAPGRAMSRSTVQDKISGKSLPRLGQILALVQACADYANAIGAPLPKEDTDERVWRERVRAALARTPAVAPSLSTPDGASAARPTAWDLDPLVRAGMHDMVTLIQNNEGQPMFKWLPELITALNLSGMSITQFLKAASVQLPSDFVDTALSLTECGEKIVERLMFLAATHQPVDAIPAVVVSLRRREASEGAELAMMLIDFIAGSSGRGYPTMRHDCASIVLALRGATLERDANRLLSGIGKCRYARSLLEIAASFPDEIYGDRETILNSVAKATNHHLGSVFKELRNRKVEGINPERTVNRIIFGIPSERHEHILQYLESEGFDHEAGRARELKDEPPF